MGTFEDYDHYSLAVSVSLSTTALAFAGLGKAAGVTDEQHLIPGDHYMWVSFPICVPVCDES